MGPKRPFVHWRVELVPCSFPRSKASCRKIASSTINIDSRKIGPLSSTSCERIDSTNTRVYFLVITRTLKNIIEKKLII